MYSYRITNFDNTGDKILHSRNGYNSDKNIIFEPNWLQKSEQSFGGEVYPG